MENEPKYLNDDKAISVHFFLNVFKLRKYDMSTVVIVENDFKNLL
jgi:hypothetical protein